MSFTRILQTYVWTISNCKIRNCSQFKNQPRKTPIQPAVRLEWHHGWGPKENDDHTFTTRALSLAASHKFSMTTHPAKPTLAQLCHHASTQPLSRGNGEILGNFTPHRRWICLPFYKSRRLISTVAWRRRGNSAERRERRRRTPSIKKLTASLLIVVLEVQGVWVKNKAGEET